MALPIPNGNLDPAATSAGPEGSTFDIPAGRTASVWYGSASVRWVRLDAFTGTVNFDNATFGDVAPFTPKSGYYLLDPDGSGGSLSVTASTDSFGLATCVAGENESYTNAGTYTAWYGNPSVNLVRLDNQTGTITFNNASFGGDPAPGVVKYGFILLSAPAGITTPYEVNLATEGSNTWAVFNSGTSGVANQRKASSDSDNKISDLGTNISTGTTYLEARASTDLVKSIWTGGTPTASGDTVGMVGNTFNQVDNRTWSIGVAEDFIADTTERTLKLYVVSKGGLRISAVLSDGSFDGIAQTYKTNVATTALANEGAYIRSLSIFTIVYKAASPGQTLRVKITANEPGDNDNRTEMYVQSVTLADNGAAPANGSANQTLPSVTQVTSGTTPHAGQASQTLKPVTQTATGSTPHAANANQTLPAVTQNASGSVPFGASANQTLKPVTQVTSGTTPHAANANQTLPPVTQNASGTVGDARNASANQTLRPVTQNASASTVAAAQADQTLAAVTQVSSGVTPHAANANQTLAAVTQIANGTVGDTRNAQASQTLQPVTQVTSGSITANAQADQALAAVTQVTSGEVIGGTDGTALQTLRPVTQIASGSVTANAAAVQFLQAVRQLARGETGTGNRVINNPITVYVQPDELISVYNNDGFIVEI